MKIGPIKLVPEESTDSIENDVRMLARKVENPGLVEDAIGHGGSWLPWSHHHPSKHQNLEALVEVAKQIGVHRYHMIDQHGVDGLDQLWLVRSIVIT